ncbi:CD1375 family protein [Enterococcus cecorum]|nr:CD1375 family protein [Enterococcus cecorum]
MEKIYFRLIQKHLRTLDSVPEKDNMREKVKVLLDEAGLDENGNVKGE